MSRLTTINCRQNTEAQPVFYGIMRCQLGLFLAASSNTGVCAILLGDDPASLLEDLQKQFPAACLDPKHPGVGQAFVAVAAYLENPAQGLTLPFHLQGTSFQKRVWRALCRIPSGATSTYTEVAQEMGAPQAVRAVASACAANTLAIAIPCHRVLRRDGSLANYRWGIERKRALLEIESR